MRDFLLKELGDGYCKDVHFTLSHEIGGLGLRNSKMVTVEYFNWHIFLMGTAFLLFMLPGTISFEIYPFTRNINKNLHGLLNTFSFICVIVALIVILDCHNILTDTGSFQTTHGICGLITIILFALNDKYLKKKKIKNLKKKKKKFAFKSKLLILKFF